MSEVSIEPLLAVRGAPCLLPPPSQTRRLSLEEAYAVQDRLREAFVAAGEQVIGWKAGLTNRTGQQQFQLQEPVSAFLLGSGVFPSGAAVPMARFTNLAVEAEVGLVLKEALGGPGMTPARAMLAVAGAVPALELVDFRQSGTPVGSDLVADGVYANAVVLGGALTPVAHLDLALEGLVYELNGAVAATATAAEVMGSPANSLAWIVNHLASRGLGLRAGDLVMTGSVSLLLRPKAGDSVRATFTRLGTVAARFV
jgi:2-keto-4-pentenoate hydratase